MKIQTGTPPLFLRSFEVFLQSSVKLGLACMTKTGSMSHLYPSTRETGLVGSSERCKGGVPCSNDNQAWLFVKLTCEGEHFPVVARRGEGVTSYKLGGGRGKTVLLLIFMCLRLP